MDKRLLLKVFLPIFLLSFSFTSIAQVTNAHFTIPSQVCKMQAVNVDNNSTNALRYEWDLNQGDFELTPSALEVTVVPGSVTTGIDVIFDGENWYGFVTSRETNSIAR